MEDKEEPQKVQVRVEQPPTQDASRTKGASSGSSSSSSKDRCRALLQSPHFQGSMQIAAGVFVASLFTFIQPLHYPQSCTAVTFFLVVAVQSSLNSHLGTRINAAASVFGAMWTGALAGGAVATLSKLPGPHTPASAAILCVLGCCVICVMSVNRVAALPPGLWAQGMVNCLTFGMMCISTWKSTTIAQVWTAAGFMLLSSAIACALSVLTAALVLPSLASDQVVQILANVLRSAGTGTSRYAARLFRPQPDDCLPPAAAAAVASLAAAAAASGKAGNHPSSGVDVSAAPLRKLGDVITSRDEDAGGEDDEEDEERLYSLGLAAPALLMPDELTDEQWRALMQRNSEPEPRPAPKAYKCPMPQLPVMGLRPQLAQVNNFLLPAAAAEPQWLRSGCSCFGSSSGGWFEAAAWAKIVAALQLLISRLSALEVLIEDGESLNLSGQFHPQLLQRLSLVYSQTATSLALMAQTVASYGASDASSSSSTGSASGSGGSIAAVGPFCEVVDVFGRSWREAKDDLAAFMQAEVNYHWSGVMAAEPDSPALLPSLSSVRHLMFTWSLTNGMIDATDQLEKALAAAVCAVPPPSPLQAACGWLLPLLPAAAAVDMFRHWRISFGQQLPAMAKQGWAGLAATAASPVAQAGFKYALALSLILTATILALFFSPQLADFNPAYGYVAASLAMSERVEATFSKVAFWIGGTLVGGALGFLLMFHPALAGNPVGLAAVIAVFAFLVGGFMPSRSKVVITLSLMTLTAIVLCQCCHAAAGEPFYALTRVVSVVSGTLFSVLLCQALLPWYTSQWALEAMAATYQTCIAAVMDMQVVVWNDGAAAVSEFEMSCTEQHQTFQAIMPSRTINWQAADTGSDAGSGPLACAGPLRHDATDAEAAATAAAALAAASASAQQQLHLLQPPAPGTQQPSKQVLATPGGLQLLVAKPLVAVQGSLIRDAVAWQKGVLATPPIVPKLLRVMLGVLDRLGALQLSLSPPIISGRFTGYHMLHYAVPMQQLQADLMPLLVELANTTCRALLQPSCDNSHAVQQAIDRLQDHRMELFRAMRALRQQLHSHVLEEQQQQVACTAAADNAAAAAAAAALPGAGSDAAAAAVEAAAAAAVACDLADSGEAARRRRLAMLLGAVDDVVRFMSFQFAVVKAADRLVAAARLAAGDVCRKERNTQLSALK